MVKNGIYDYVYQDRMESVRRQVERKRPFKTRECGTHEHTEEPCTTTK